MKRYINGIFPDMIENKGTVKVGREELSGKGNNENVLDVRLI
ncbi:hypothetical protein SAMN05443633_12221 [Chryseobacterium arachidis]|uniref:Uncharacterized protein n=1 Tax=Chryseobacterium arachidis TaxID=1416778 RepID=A0A1M5MGQ0_9FLAO|nr:hypothetical protein [Chryseobacterium arachidis]SHG76371.1 hypothetical protein SAMN05443633_12221 [Chryseobacterium arachidis]